MRTKPLSSVVAMVGLVLAGLLPGGGSAASAGSTPPDPADEAVTSALVGFTDIAAGPGAHTCGLGNGNALVCWGDNSVGQLGVTPKVPAPTPAGVPMAGMSLAGKVVAQVAPGSADTCALTTDGAVACWGLNLYGEAGNGTIGAVAKPTAIVVTGTPLEGKVVTQVSSGDATVCALTTDSTIACWGFGGQGELGTGTTANSTVPVAVKVAGTPLAGKSISQVDAGSGRVCAVASDGTIACWGDNATGAIGDGTTNPALLPVAAKRAGTALTGRTWVAVAVGVYHTCARSTDGAVACWGQNNGRLGNGSTDNSLVAVAVKTTGAALAGKQVVGITAGLYNTCALASDGTMACWGLNTYGVLGTGNATNVSVPTAVVTGGTVFAGRTVAQLISAPSHSCARTTDGRVGCWGLNNSGELGNGSQGTWTLPHRVVPGALAGKTVQGLSVGNAHGCALATDSTIACWGSNTGDVLGTGMLMESSSTPVAVSRSVPALAGKTVTQVAAGYAHTCTVATDTTMACWGSNGHGQLGNGGIGGTESLPVAVTKTGTPLAGKTIVQVAVNGLHSCARAVDSTVACWGYGSDGRLGNGSTDDQPTPVAVTKSGTPLFGKTILSIGLGQHHTCALATDSTVACWGNGFTGRLGNGLGTSSSVPVSIDKNGTPLAGKTITQISVGSSHTCALTSEGAVACWGAGGDGRLGTGDTVMSPKPTAVLTAGTPIAGKPVVHIAAFDDHTCAVTSDGTVACWGAGGHGQLGNGLRLDSYVPVAVTRTGTPLQGKTVSKLGGGELHTCALTTDGTLACWGDNDSGEVGDGGGWYSKVPTTVLSASTSAAAYAPFASWAAFVDRQFRDVTGVPPTASELSAWTSQLAAGSASKGDLDHALRRGPENLTSVDPTARLYRAFLARTPDAGGLRFWIGRKRSGSWTLVRIADSFASSSEFKTKYGALTNRDFVTRIYTDVLGRAADLAGVDYWTRQLDLKRRTRGSVMVGFSESNEYRTKQADNTDAGVAHILLLGRAPTKAELAIWVAREASGVPHQVLLAELLDSPAYATHLAP